LTAYVSQGSAATDLRGGGSFSFFYRSFLNLTVKKYENYENRCTVAEVIIKIKVTHVFEIRGFDSIQPTIVTDSTVGHPLADDGKNLASPLARQC